MAHLDPDAVLLVTGATGGIGLEIAKQAAAGGTTVAVHGSRIATVEAAMDKIRAVVPAAKLIAVPGDFREDGVVEAVVAAVVARTGRLDAMVHCAITGAAGARGLFAETDPKSYGAHAALVMGIFQQLCFAALPHLTKQCGAIIGFASDAGRFASARQTIIGGAFGGIMAFVRSLAMEVARDGVRVHCISPSYVADTPVFDRYAAGAGDRGVKAQQRAGLGLPTPRDIAPMALFLCGPEATKMTGQIISINGGLNT
ncbi:MAG: SDR family oxidoreductase [Sphingobium sp.]